MPDRIEKHIIGFCGFTEQPSEETTRQSGIFDLFDQLWVKRSKLDAMIHAPYLWDHSISNLAAFLRGRGAKKVLVYGYSWGGCTAINLCKKISEIEVSELYLSDPVRRPFSVMGRLSLLRNLLPFYIPRNVKSTRLYRQEGDWPTGFSGKVHSSLNQTIEEFVAQKVKHVDMDKYPGFTADVLKAADRL